MLSKIRNGIGRLPILFRLSLVLLVAAAVSAALHHVPAHVVALGVTGVLPLHAMITIPWQPALTRDELDLLANPQQANQPEVVPWQLFDTQSIATAAAGPFTYFTALNVDKTLCNMEGPGQLPDPQYFIVQYVAADILQIPTATALAGEPNAALANVENLLKTCRASFTFNMSNKRYGPFSLTMCHATGGSAFSGYGYGTAANGTSAGAVNNGNMGSGGFPFCGALVIPPKTGFDVTINLGAAATLVGGPINVRVSLVGQLYRRVL
jgi:hypothetical protein